MLLLFARSSQAQAPATVIFNADGSEIVKRQGYLPRKLMASILQAVIDDPTPGSSMEPERSSPTQQLGSLHPRCSPIA